MDMKVACIASIAALSVAAAVSAEDWIEVGADTQAKYYVDVDSIRIQGENVLVLKRGVFTQVLTDTLGSTSATFNQTVGTVEIDCARRFNGVNAGGAPLADRWRAPHQPRATDPHAERKGGAGWFAISHPKWRGG